MKLKLNGTVSEFQEEMTLTQLLENLKIEPKAIAVEVNLNIIKKTDYQSYMLKDGDTVEVVKFVGGG
ncbi:MAG: sulfur carrier protein ThiS [Nitrospirae bacterium]|nr:sulfur carrier protein ThiS [Nitrospirota bacterium]